MGQKESILFNNKAGGKTSGNINRVSYYPESHILEVKFKNGSIYHYEGVPSRMWIEAQEAPSIGSFMHGSIIGIYPHSKVK